MFLAKNRSDAFDFVEATYTEYLSVSFSSGDTTYRLILHLRGEAHIIEVTS